MAQRERAETGTRGQRLRHRALTAISTLALMAGVAVAIAYGDSVRLLRDELSGLGVQGVLLFIVAQFLWVMTTVPSAPLMTLAGIVYGPWLGTLYVMIGSLTGVSTTFWIGRSFARDHVKRWMDRYDALCRAMRFVEAHTVMMVLVVRVLPVFPLNLLNYAFGATSIRFATYLGVSALVMVPGAGLYAGLGDVLRRAVTGERLPEHAIAWVVGFASITLALIWYAKRRSAG